MDLTPKQCFGPSCTRSARLGGKYCSDQCGINLASMRIYQILPDRIREWNLTPCVAEKKNLKELEVVRAKQVQGPLFVLLGTGTRVRFIAERRAVQIAATEHRVRDAGVPDRQG